MGHFRDKVLARSSGILSYGLTPPRAAHDRAKLAAIAQRQRAEISALPVDAIVLYDLQDESSRDASPRPFAFLPTLDPALYARDYLCNPLPDLIVYRAVANHEAAAFAAWLSSAESAAEPAAVTFVGSPTRLHPSPERLDLPRAYQLYSERCKRLLLGGIAIAERHLKKGDEHRRMLDKQGLGCSFFVSQAVYDMNASGVLIADLAREALARQLPPAPLLLTITPCGSAKSLEFMKWLGISFDPVIERRLLQSSDMLAESVAICQQLILEIGARRDGPVPLGINVESVSIRRADIEAALALVEFARRVLPT
ncbi:MAG: 5,10-methylenetetrahydrofolate reductase [Pseudomonadota bacterium]